MILLIGVVNQIDMTNEIVVEGDHLESTTLLI